MKVLSVFFYHNRNKFKYEYAEGIGKGMITGFYKNHGNLFDPCIGGYFNFKS